MHSRFMNWTLDRMQEPSTIVGLCGAISILFGYAFAIEKVQAIATIVSLVASGVCVVTKEAP